MPEMTLRTAATRAILLDTLRQILLCVSNPSLAGEPEKYVADVIESLKNGKKAELNSCWLGSYSPFLMIITPQNRRRYAIEIKGDAEAVKRFAALLLALLGSDYTVLINDGLEMSVFHALFLMQYELSY